MSISKKDDTGSTNEENFDGPEEYDIVSSQDLVLITDKTELNLEQNDPSENLLYNKQFSSVKQYEEEWNDLYTIKEIDLEKLKQKSVEGQLRTSHFRSICWRCLLGILHKQPRQWLCQLQTYRKHYDEISVELEKNPWNVGEQNPYDNPLSQDSDSIWQRYFCDEELKSVVQQDVRRTFPGMDFFRKEDIQKMMVRILFCYARQNPALCYRQGMHEILAPLIFILHCDHQAFLHAKEQNMAVDEDIHEILSPEHLEQDAFSIFKFIMSHIEYSYRTNHIINSGCFPPETQKNETKTCQNEVKSRLNNIQKNILQPKDPELNDHLEKLDIPLHLFGIRWLRLLFGREFILQDLLVLWDFIFASNFEIVNYIVVAMLVAIRNILINGDYTDCMSNLMRYPNGVDITYIIEYSLHLKNPQKHSPPDPMKISSLPESFKNKPKKFVSHFRAGRRLKKGPSQWLSDKSNLLFLGQSGDGDSAIASGYAINDPNLLKAELDQAKMIMNIVCHKLLQFHSSLTLNLQKNSNSEVQVVLDGIYELSCLLKNHFKEMNYDIETACEAGETKELKNQDSCLKKSGSKEMSNPPKASINSARKSHTLPKMKRSLQPGELTVFKHQVGGVINGAPMTDPLHLIKN